jgi:photosynthetic reaction center M subunit/photosynthetic reaction center L subunit
MSDAPQKPLLQPDGEYRTSMASESSTGAGPRATEISFEVMEARYKRQGGTLAEKIFGHDPLDFWIGPFYVGFFGGTAIVGIVLGMLGYFYQVFFLEKSFNPLATALEPPPISAGLHLVAWGQPGFAWQWTVAFSTIAFVSWMLRQVDISLKLRMGLEIPIAFGAVVSSWVTLQILRPIAMGAWGNGFPLGITHHLDWLSNIGYQYYNFFYNPFHAIGVSLLFASTLFLHMHGSAILSAARRPVNEHNVDVFWRNIVGYSIGEIGIHRLAYWAGAASVLFANVCIFISGPLVHDWNGFWAFWDRIPVWSGAGAGMLFIGAGLVFSRRSDKLNPEPDLVAAESVQGLEGTIGSPAYVNLMDRLFGSGRVLPIYVGVWGVIGVFAFAICAFIILQSYMYEVGYSPINFAREFWNLAVMPPATKYGLSWNVPWYEGGDYLVATFFLHISVLAWYARLYERARKTGLAPHLAIGFWSALFIYFTIYLIRPVLRGYWADAPGQGFRAILDWTNYVNLQVGNIYYNPFHMISIFFLLGSVLILAIHGATIVATSKWGAEREIDEMVMEGSGTHRAQLFWRWTMGFNANSYNIHLWAWWFAALCGITAAIGILISGTLVDNWFVWAQNAHIVAPMSTEDWSQYIFSK